MYCAIVLYSHEYQGVAVTMKPHVFFGTKKQAVGHALGWIMDEDTLMGVLEDESVTHRFVAKFRRAARTLRERPSTENMKVFKRFLRIFNRKVYGRTEGAFAKLLGCELKVFKVKPTGEYYIPLFCEA